VQAAALVLLEQRMQGLKHGGRLRLQRLLLLLWLLLLLQVRCVSWYWGIGSVHRQQPREAMPHQQVVQ
jgi:hypothetical protein